MRAPRDGERAARWGTRNRIAALIAAVLVCGGALLLGAQYLAVQQLLAPGGGASTAESADLGVSPPERPRAELRSGDGGTNAEGTAADVLPALAAWSAVALLLFSALAILVARWLSRRSLRRVAQIAELARRITAEGLDERIRLGGRRDEVRDLADTVDGMLDRLRESFARQERFVANASHELRTPLTTARAALEIPLAQGRVPEDLEPAVRRALAANEKSERLIAALLALAGTGGAGGTAYGGGELRRAVAAAVEARGARAAELGIEVDLEGLRAIEGAGSPPELRVAADPALVELAVDNLVGNAVRHNVRGGSVQVSAEAAGDEIRLRVENTGARFDAAAVAALVEPFNRGDASRLSSVDAEPGLGLGLTLADEAARACGGSLDLAPRSGGGLVAVLTLPRP